MSEFTLSYSQPEDYRFSLDSVETPLLVSKQIQSEGRSVDRVLDLCAGCGVMGLEFAFHTPRSMTLDFVEIQSVYKTHFDLNTKGLLESDQQRGLSRHLQFNWMPINYDRLLEPQYQNTYDLILCNPPYFRVEQGKQSPSEFKNRCRFFIDSSPEKLWSAIIHALKPHASAYVLLRDLDEHGWNQYQEMTQALRYSATVESWKDVRGTRLVKMTSS